MDVPGQKMALSSANAKALGLGTGSYTLYGFAPPFGADASLTFANSFEPEFDYKRLHHAGVKDGAT